MGLKIKQEIGTSNQGHLEEFYVRIENLILDKNEKYLIVVMAAYPSSDDSRISSPIYDNSSNSNFSGIIGVDIIYKGEKISYPVIIEHKMGNRGEITDLYSYGYDLVRSEFGKIFGEKNIFNEL